jgi:hypothetical protein
VAQESNNLAPRKWGHTEVCIKPSDASTIPEISEPTFTPALAAHVHPNMLSGKLFQSNQISQPHRGHQPGMRHEIWVIEAGASLARSMQQLHLRGALSAGSSELQQLRLSQVKGHFCHYDTLLATIPADLGLASAWNMRAFRRNPVALVLRYETSDILA